MNANKNEVENNMQVMLDSLEESSLDVIAQALQTIASMCSEKDAQEILRERGGLNRIFLLLKTTEHLSIRQYSMFALGCALSGNVNSQMAMCKPELFSYLRSVLSCDHEMLKLKCVAAFLVNMLVCNNTAGQKLAHECNLLRCLMDILRVVWNVSNSYMDVHSVNFNLLLSVCNALSAAVNNPQNADNQRTCSSLFPFLSEMFPVLTTPLQLSPVTGFLISCVTNHFMNQERVRAVGVLKVLVSELQKKDLNVEDDLSTCVFLVDALVHCSNVNKNNQQVLVDLKVIPTIVCALEVLKDPLSLLKVLTCLHMLTSDSVDGQQQVVQCGGIPLLVKLLADSQDSDLKQVSVFVLQSCLRKKLPISSDSSPPEADVAIRKLESLMEKLMSCDFKTNHSASTRAVAAQPLKPQTCEPLQDTLTGKHVSQEGRLGPNIDSKLSGLSKSCLNIVHYGDSPQTHKPEERPSNVKFPFTKQAKARVGPEQSNTKAPRCEMLKHNLVSVVPHPPSNNTRPGPDGSGSGYISEKQEAPSIRVPPLPSQKAPQEQPQTYNSTAVLQLHNISTSLEKIKSDLSLLEAHHRQSEQSVQSQLESLQGDLKRIQRMPGQCSRSDTHSTKVVGSHPHPRVKDESTNRSNAKCRRHHESVPLSTTRGHQPAITTPTRPRDVSESTTLPIKRPIKASKCALCTSVNHSTIHYSNSRNLMKRVYNDPHTCEVHEHFARQALVTKCQYQQRAAELSTSRSVSSSQPCATHEQMAVRDLPSPILPCTPAFTSIDVKPLSHGSIQTNPSPSGPSHSASPPLAGSCDERGCLTGLQPIVSTEKLHHPKPLCSTSKPNSTCISMKHSHVPPATKPRSPRKSYCDKENIAIFTTRASSHANIASRTYEETAFQHSQKQALSKNDHKPTTLNKRGQIDVYEFNSPDSFTSKRRPRVYRCGTQCGAKRRRVPFTQIEEEHIIQGVAKFGTKWRHILSSYPFKPCRTVVDIKDKYRNIMCHRNKYK